MRYFLFSIGLLFFSITNFAQNKTDTVSSKLKTNFIISGGYGRPNFRSIFIKNGYDGNSEYSNVIDKGTFFLKIEYLFLKERPTVSVGGTLYYTQFSYFDMGNTSASHFGLGSKEYNFKNLGIGLRFNMYLIYKKNFNFYIGLGGGTQIPLKSNDIALFGEVVLGTRFMFTKNIGLYVEVGAAKAIAQAGLSFKF